MIRRYLSPIQSRIFEGVRRVAPDMIATPDLEDFVYRNAPDGGATSKSIMPASVYYTNRHLVKFGLRIQGKKGRGGGYRLIQL